jgi:hypothetical protein
MLHSLVDLVLLVLSCWNSTEICTEYRPALMKGSMRWESVALQVYLTARGHSIEFRWTSQLPFPPPPLPFSRSTQLLTVDWIFGVDSVELWVAQSILKRTLMKQWRRSHAHARVYPVLRFGSICLVFQGMNCAGLGTVAHLFRCYDVGLSVKKVTTSVGG